MQNVTLKEHNVPVYERFEKALEEGSHALLNSCPGSGKSYVLLKFLQNHPGKALVVCPKNSIRDEWDRAGEKYGVPIHTVTYHLLGRLDEAGLKNLADGYDYIVFDEAHHMGAATWQESITTLRKTCPDKKYIGLTATPVRYTDGMRDVGDEFFAGNAVSGTSQTEAVEKGILPGYKYVSALFGLSEEVKRLKEAEDMDDVVCEKIRHLENCAENRNGIYEAFDKYMPEGERKGIVFVDKIENIPSAVEIMKGYYDDDVPYFVINSKISQSKNTRTLHEFEEAESGWIFVVDMLNEGLHISGVNTIVMLRKTVSPNVFIQQLGRSQAAGASEAVIFDFVGNRKSLMAMGFVPVREGNGTKMRYAEDPRVIIDYVETEAVSLLNELEEQLREWRPWTEEEETFLKENYRERGSVFCSEHLPGRSATACVAHAQRLGLVAKNKWTPEEDEVLRKYYTEKGSEYCSKILGRTPGSCRRRAGLLGLSGRVQNKKDRWDEDDRAFLVENYKKYGAKYCSEHLERSLESIRGQAHRLGLSDDKRDMSSWRSEEDEFLWEHAPNEGVRYCSKHLGRTEYMCRKRVKELEVPVRKGKSWTEEEAAFVRDNYPDKGIEYCAKHLGRSEASCMGMAVRQGLKRPDPKWTPEEDEFLLVSYAEYGVKYCAAHLGRSESACSNRAIKLGVRLNRLWTEEEDDVMKAGYPVHGLDWCVERLPKRSRSACVNRARILGLKRCG